MRIVHLLIFLLVSTMVFAQHKKTDNMPVSCVVVPSIKIAPTAANVRLAFETTQRQTSLVTAQPTLPATTNFVAAIPTVVVAGPIKVLEVDAEYAQAIVLGYREETGNSILQLDGVVFSVDEQGLTVSTR